jgi:hypothetical protein
MPRECPFRVQLSPGERAQLEACARRYTSPYRDVIRAKIVLYAAAGLDNDDFAARLDTPRQIADFRPAATSAALFPSWRCARTFSFCTASSSTSNFT